MSDIKPKYTLFETLNQMLAPEALSELISKTVTRVDIQPMEHPGFAGSQLSHMDTDAGRFVLKQMSREFDWAMFISNDHSCRAVTLWQYGLLDQLQPHADHKIIACAREGNVWTIMMEDLGENIFHEEKNPFSPELIPPLLDTLARVHATFWNKSNLTNAQLGLCSPAEFLDGFSPSTGTKDSGGAQSVVKGMIEPGWAAMEEVLDASVFKHMRSLSDDLTPLLNALARYPSTLLHGDIRRDNLAYTDRFVLLDWQIATYSLMTVDLAWLTRDISDFMEPERAIQLYRQQLETHLNQPFEDSEWQNMIKLGFAAEAIRTTFLFGHWYKFEENPDMKELARSRIIEQGQMVMDALPLF